MRIAAYKETSYMDCMTADDMISREEWRVRGWAGDADFELAKRYYGSAYAGASDDSWVRLFANRGVSACKGGAYWLEHRYIRRCVDGRPYDPARHSPYIDYVNGDWRVHEIFPTRDKAFRDIDGFATPTCKALEKIQAGRKAEARKRDDDERKARQDAARKERNRREAVERNACWDRLRAKHPDVCLRWETMGKQIQASARLMDLAKDDAAFRELVRVAQEETRMPSRRRAIREACEYAAKHFEVVS